MKIVCPGDSITGQPNLASCMKWSFILEVMCDAAKGLRAVQVVNRGIGGDTSAGALKRLQGDVLDEKPDVAIILLWGAMMRGRIARPPPSRPTWRPSCGRPRGAPRFCCCNMPCCPSGQSRNCLGAPG